MNLAAVLLLLSTGACQGTKTRGHEEVPPQLTFDSLEFRVFRGAVLTAHGTAMHATFRRDTGDLAAERVSTRLPATSAQPEARISAGQGQGNVKDHRFTAWGGVRAQQSGQVATTSEAHYSAEDGMVRGDHPVEVRSARMTVRGPGFTLDPRDQALRLEGGPRVVTGGGAP